MSSDAALRNKTRRTILSFISDNPGSSFSTIRDALDMVDGTLTYHLNYMERRSLISSEQKGKFRCYYPGESGGSLTIFKKISEFDPTTLTQLQQQILTIIRQKPGISIVEMETMMGQSRRVLQYNVKVLRERMLVWKEGNGKSSRYEYATNERLRNELTRFMMMKFLNGEIDEETYLRYKGEIERERMKEEDRGQ